MHALQPSGLATVVIPALNEARRIGDVVRHVRLDPAVREVFVVDDSSIDETASLAREAGAQVLTSSMLGKGASMRDGVSLGTADILVYLDGDLTSLQPGLASALCRPIADGEADFVKARFGRGGGRVTELTAKPMLKVFFPELANFAQPLGGIIAARRALLRSLPFEDTYGVDVGLLIDAYRAGARLAEIDIGHLEHDSQSLQDLTDMANEVARTIYSRARLAGRLHVEQVTAMYEIQRQATASIDDVLSRRRGRRRILLLDMESTLTKDRYVLELARATGREDQFRSLSRDTPASTHSEAIAAMFRFVHRDQFERVARDLRLRPGVIDTVNGLRRHGFMVGLVSDSYYVAADILRRRVFADFAVAHTLHFDGDVCNGQLRWNPAFLPSSASDATAPGKAHVVRRFREDTQLPRVDAVWAVSDDDAALLAAADRGFYRDPVSVQVTRLPGATRLVRFEDLLKESMPQAGETATH